MSNVWKTRYRLLLEKLNQLADEVGGDQRSDSAAVTEHTVRLLTFAAIVLRQHHINKRGQCNFCGWSRWVWRFWRRRPQCTVYRGLASAMGEQRSLVEVREWLTQRDQETTVPIGLPPSGA